MIDRAAIVAVVALALVGGALYLRRRDPGQGQGSAPLLDLSIPSLDANLGLSGFSGLAGTTIGDFLNQAAVTLGASQPRGVRNNNPGNVKKGGSTWRGASPAADQTDPVFVRFTDPKWGIRVIAYLLKSYQRNKGKRTLRQLISEPGGWAPSNVDDNPSGYANFIADRLDVTIDTPLYFETNPAQLRAVVVAIIAFENNGFSYAASVVDEGIALA